MIPLAQARARAEALVELFRANGDCPKIEIAGSIRRGKPQVKDIEIVAEPYVRTDLFGAPLDEQTKLDLFVEKEVAAGRLRKRLRADGGVQSWGPKYKAIVTADDMPLDLFIVRAPAQWGAVFAIRTGPGDFSKFLVTACRSMGLRCDEARLVRLADGSTFPTPTEEDFFKACGVPWRRPEERR